MTREERDKAIRILQWLHDNNFLFRSTEEDVKFATEYAIKALEQEDILDKIKEEIKDNTYFINETTEKEGIDFETVEKIIDKYKAESEEQE